MVDFTILYFLNKINVLPNRYGYSILLIGGTESGKIVVLDLNTGSVQYDVQSHTSKIVKIVSNVRSKEIITSGAGWKVVV